MLQLVVTIRSCRGSCCHGIVHGQVALISSKSVCRNLGTQDSHSQCGQDIGLRCPCVRSLFDTIGFGLLLNNLMHLGHTFCSTVNPIGALERLMFHTFERIFSLGSSHQSSVVAFASIVFHVPGRKNHVRFPRGPIIGGVSNIGFDDT